MRYLVIILTLFLAGCYIPMSHEDVQEKSLYCSEQGLSAYLIVSKPNQSGERYVVAVRCKDANGNLFKVPSDYNTK